MLADFPFILRFWLVLFIIGLINLPLTTVIFRRLPDRGYIFSRILALLLISYGSWLLASLRLLAFDPISLLLAVILLLMINLAILVKSQPSSLFRQGFFGVLWREVSRLLALPNIKYLISIIIIEEVLFLLSLVFLSYVRGFQPDIRGLEKFMDFGFINSIIKGQFMPPRDLWLAPHAINYYYFGHLTGAVLTLLSGIPSFISYNLILAYIFAACFTGSFSLGFNLWQIAINQHLPISNIKYPLSIITGLLAAFLTTLAGNLHTIYAFTKGYPNEQPVPFWQILSKWNPGSYWYPNATRFIPFTIHEFPSYSFVVADLHGHVFSIPFVLLTIALLLVLFKSLNSRPKLNKSDIRILLLGLVLAVLYMTNALDALIYGALTALIFFVLHLRGRVVTRPYKSSLTFFNIPISQLLNYLITLIATALLTIVFSLPFHLSFKPFSTGIGLSKDQSPLWMLLVLWGFFYFNAIAFLVFLWKKRQVPTSRNPCLAGRQAHPATHIPQPTTHLIVSFLGFRVEIKRERPSVNVRQAGPLQPSSPLTPAPQLLKHPLQATSYKLQATDKFILILIFFSTLLLIFPEFFYFKDIYPAHYRANTMFKLGYQAYIMLSIASAYIIIRLWRTNPKFEARNSKQIQNSNVQMTKTFRILNFEHSNLFRISIFGFRILIIPLLFLVLLYPYFSFPSYYGLKKYKGLDGTRWLAEQFPDDDAAVEWLKNNAYQLPATSYQLNYQPSDFIKDFVIAPKSSPPIILEAVGDSYTDYARISVHTGLATVQGWPVHEWLWRGSYDEPGRRVAEVAQIYESFDLVQTKQSLTNYGVKYVIIGNFERQKYPNLNEEKFKQLGRLVFTKGTTKIYEIRY